MEPLSNFIFAGGYTTLLFVTRLSGHCATASACPISVTEERCLCALVTRQLFEQLLGHVLKSFRLATSNSDMGFALLGKPLAPTATILAHNVDGRRIHRLGFVILAVKRWRYLTSCMVRIYETWRKAWEHIASGCRGSSVPWDNTHNTRIAHALIAYFLLGKWISFLRCLSVLRDFSCYRV